MFQLIKPTTVTLLHVNMRTEKHGTDDIDAYDFDFVLERANSEALALLHADLCESVYYRAEATEDQADIPTVEKTRPNLRFPKMAPIVWVDEAEGVDLSIEYGLGDELSNIKLEAGKSSTKKAECKEGGTSLVYFRFSTSHMQDGVMDKLRKKLKQELTITLVQPDKLIQQTVIDGTVGHPGVAAKTSKKKAGKNATQEFIDQHAET